MEDFSLTKIFYLKVKKKDWKAIADFITSWRLFDCTVEFLGVRVAEEDWILTTRVSRPDAQKYVGVWKLNQLN